MASTNLCELVEKGDYKRPVEEIKGLAYRAWGEGMEHTKYLVGNAALGGHIDV